MRGKSSPREFNSCPYKPKKRLDQGCGLSYKTAVGTLESLNVHTVLDLMEENLKQIT